MEKNSQRCPKITIATVRRARRYQALINEFSHRDMTTLDVGHVLFCSKENAKRYIEELLRRNIIIASYKKLLPNSTGKITVYSHSDDPRSEQEFIKAITMFDFSREVDLENPTESVANVEKIYHAAADESNDLKNYSVVKDTVQQVKRDPMVEAFFGMAPAPIQTTSD